MKKSYKKLAVVMAIMIFTLSIASSVFAAGTIKNLKAVYNNIKIFVNGTQVSMPAEPFIIDGTTYVPLRAVSEILDKVVTWDQATYSVNINDKPGTSMTELYNQIYNYQIQISQLEKKIKDLESKEKTSATTISAMKKQLNNDYGKYEKIDFDFDLSESKSKITVKIYVDLDVDSTRWNKLSTKDIESFLQDVVDDILKNFPDKTISGYIEDSDASKKLVNFTVSSKGKVSTSKSSSGSSSDVEDMESDLHRYYSGSDGIEEVRLSISKSKLYLTVYVDKDDWNYLKTSKKETILENMYEDIREYFDETIVGEIIDDYSNKVIDEFEYSSKGVVNIY